MSKKELISSTSEYQTVLKKLESIMLKGSENVSGEELQEIRDLGLAVQQYEREHYIIDEPETLAGMIELRMYQLKIRQKDLADKLQVSQAKLSLILNGKQKPDISFLKLIRRELNIDADFILDKV